MSLQDAADDAIIIRDETTTNANTATRVGSALLQIIDGIAGDEIRPTLDGGVSGSVNMSKDWVQPINCNANDVPVNPPVAPEQWDRFWIFDPVGSWQGQKVTVDFVTEGDNFESASKNYIGECDFQFVGFMYVDATIGWVVVDDVRLKRAYAGINRAEAQAAQTLTDGTEAKVTFATNMLDVGATADQANDRVDINDDGVYELEVFASVTLDEIATLQLIIKEGSTPSDTKALAKQTITAKDEWLNLYAKDIVKCDSGSKVEIHATATNVQGTPTTTDMDGTVTLTVKRVG